MLDIPFPGCIMDTIIAQEKEIIMSYLRNDGAYLNYSSIHKFDMDELEKVLKKSFSVFKDAYTKRHKYDPANFIPMRNLSGGIGEAFAQMLVDTTEDLKINPHPDGYPDVLPNTKDAKKWVETPTLENFKKGGFDIKAKYIGNDIKIDVNASAHHTQTTSVLNVMWKWKDGVPFIIGIAYTDDLTEKDWPTPSKGKVGSKTTPSCSINKSGKVKLRNNWLFLDEESVKLHGLSNPKDWNI